MVSEPGPGTVNVEESPPAEPELEPSDMQFDLATHINFTITDGGYFLTFAKSNPKTGWEEETARAISIVAKVFLPEKTMRELVLLIDAIPSEVRPSDTGDTT